MRTLVPATLWTLLLTATLAAAVATHGPPPQNPRPSSPETHTVLQTTVRRVVLDVVVTAPQGSPVRGLTAADFLVTEDGKPQHILSCDANGFSSAMDYLPPTLPPQPPNTFINLPATPEKGPLYVLLYDLVNIDSPDQMMSPEDHSTQMIARQQMTKFIQSKPAGARFAIFVRSDGLHLLQGFTSDKSLLYAALDPHSPRPHIPTVFLMAPNFGRGDSLSALDTLHSLAVYLDGLPGRKNLIWFSSAFPLSLFASDTEGPSLQQESKATLDLLAHNQIAVYPVDARGVPLHDSHTQIATSVHSDTVTSSIESSASSGAAAPSNSPSQNSSFMQGSSSVMTSYATMDEIARETGGHAFYGNNDVAGELLQATQNGGVYYTLTYAPTNGIYNGKLRNIHIQLAAPVRNAYNLAYRRFYYGTESPQPTGSQSDLSEPSTSSQAAALPPQHRPIGDTLSANMQHGAPPAHQLVFIVQAQTVGAPAPGTPQQMAELATEPAYFKSRRRSQALKPLPPIPLQKDVFDFNIPTRQFRGEASLNLEVAVAAYDADGRLMNAFVSVAKNYAVETSGAQPPRFYRVEQQLDVPLAATSIRFAVRDTSNDRTGAMETSLPLAPDNTPPLTPPIQ